MLLNGFDGFGRLDLFAVLLAELECVRVDEISTLVPYSPHNFSSSPPNRLVLQIMKPFCRVVSILAAPLLASHFVPVDCTNLRSGSGQLVPWNPPPQVTQSPESMHQFIDALHDLKLAQDRISRDFQKLFASISSTVGVFHEWGSGLTGDFPQLLKNALFASSDIQKKDPHQEDDGGKDLLKAVSV